MSMTNYTSSVHAGGTLSVVDGTKNIGGSMASFTIGYVLSPNSVIGDSDDIMLPTTRSVTNLYSGSTSKVPTTVTVPSSVPPGVYYVGTIADVNNAVTELNEGNNTYKAGTLVTVSP
jgi:hypothetical protein